MAAPVFDRAKAVRALVDAIQFGDAQACAKNGIALRTLQSYRAKLSSDPELARARAKFASTESHGWAIDRHRFLRAATKKLTTMVEMAEPDQIRDVSEAIERIGNIDIAMHALLGDYADPEGQGPAEDAGGPAEDAEASEGSEEPRQSDDVMDRLFGKLEGDPARRDSDPSALRPGSTPPEE